MSANQHQGKKLRKQVGDDQFNLLEGRNKVGSIDYNMDSYLLQSFVPYHGSMEYLQNHPKEIEPCCREMKNLEQYKNYESSLSSEKLLTSSEGSYLMSISENSLGKRSYKSS